MLAILSLCLCGSEVIAQQPSPKSSGPGSMKASQPPDTPATVAETGSNALKKQIKQLDGMRATLFAERRDIQRQILERCGLSPENAKPLLLSLERDRFNLQISLEPERAHVRILTKMVAEIAEQAKKRSESDRVTEGLKRIVAARRAIVEKLRTLAATGQATPLEADKAEAELAEAEVRLALRAEEIARSQGDGELDRLNRQLRERSNELLLKEVRLKELDHRLGNLQGVLNMVDEYNAVSERLKTVDQDIEQREEGLRLSEL